MPRPDRFIAYIMDVCDQVRCQKARPDIATELANHMEDQCGALLADGLNDTAAQEVTVRQMGDPIVVGSQLDATHRPKIEWRTLLLAALLVAAGTLIQVGILRQAEIVFDTPVRSLLYALVFGLIAMAVIFALDYTILAKAPVIVYLSFCAVLIALSFLVSQQISKDAMYGLPQAMPYMGYAVLLAIPFFCALLYRQKSNGNKGMLFCALMLLIPMSICFFLPNATALIIVAACGTAVLCVASVKEWFGKVKLAILWLLIPPIAMLGMFTLLDAFRMGYFNYGIVREDGSVSSPGDYFWSSPTYSNLFSESWYEQDTIQAIMRKSPFIGQAVVMPADLYIEPAPVGVPVPMAMPRFILPEPGMAGGWVTTLGGSGIPEDEQYVIDHMEYTAMEFLDFNRDYMLTYAIGMYGWWTGLLFIGGIGVLIWRMFVMAFRQKNRLGFFLLFGVSSVFLAQTLFYLLANLGVSIMNPLTLPLLLGGGTGLTVNLAMFGLFLSVCKYNGIVSDRAVLSQKMILY